MISPIGSRINFTTPENFQGRLVGDTGKALLRNLFSANRQGPLPLLNFRLGEVFDNPFNPNKTRFARICLPAGRQGSVPDESA